MKELVMALCLFCLKPEVIKDENGIMPKHNLLMNGYDPLSSKRETYPYEEFLEPLPHSFKEGECLSAKRDWSWKHQFFFKIKETGKEYFHVSMCETDSQVSDTYKCPKFDFDLIRYKDDVAENYYQVECPK